MGQPGCESLHSHVQDPRERKLGFGRSLLMLSASALMLALMLAGMGGVSAETYVGVGHRRGDAGQEEVNAFSGVLRPPYSFNFFRNLNDGPFPLLAIIICMSDRSWSDLRSAFILFSEEDLPYQGWRRLLFGAEQRPVEQPDGRIASDLDLDASSAEG